MYPYLEHIHSYIFSRPLLHTVDSRNSIQICHLQCRSSSCNAAAVSWTESIVSLTQSVLCYPCKSSITNTLKGTCAFYIQFSAWALFRPWTDLGKTKEKQHCSHLLCFLFFWRFVLLLIINWKAGKIITSGHRECKNEKSPLCYNM